MDIERHFRFLIGCESGRWLLTRLLAESHQFGPITRYGNNKDNTEAGKYDLIEEQITRPIIKHFGYAAFDAILKGSK